MAQLEKFNVTDLYGFPIRLDVHGLNSRRTCDARDERQLESWKPYVEKKRLPKDKEKLKEMIRSGVPPNLRHWVWMETSGANKKKAGHADSYYSLFVKAGEDSPYKKDIEMDAQRTFPTHPWLASADGRAALTRVLQAYSMHNTRTGYIRATSCIVGLMLVSLNRNEEAAFWLLAALVEDILHPGTYSRNLEGCQVDLRALSELIASKLPKLAAHLTSLDFQLSSVATDWFLGLFSSSLPAETVMRVWDALFFEGPKILFRVALALLTSYEHNLCKDLDSGVLLMHIRCITANLHNRDLLMSNAFYRIGALPTSTIERIREQKQRGMEAVAVAVVGNAGGDCGASSSCGGADPAMEKAVAAEVQQGIVALVVDGDGDAGL